MSLKKAPLTETDNEETYILREVDGMQVVYRYVPPNEYLQYYHENREALEIDGNLACWLPIFKSPRAEEAEAYLRHRIAEAYVPTEENPKGARNTG